MSPTTSLDSLSNVGIRVKGGLVTASVREVSPREKRTPSQLGLQAHEGVEHRNSELGTSELGTSELGTRNLELELELEPS
jgi:hypothetical protein